MDDGLGEGCEGFEVAERVNSRTELAPLGKWHRACWLSGANAPLGGRGGSGGSRRGALSRRWCPRAWGVRLGRGRGP
jgi:hypothetical protein